MTFTRTALQTPACLWWLRPSWTRVQHPSTSWGRTRLRTSCSMLKTSPTIRTGWKGTVHAWILRRVCLLLEHIPRQPHWLACLQVLLWHLEDAGHQRPGHERLPGRAVPSARQPVQQHVSPSWDLLLHHQVQGRGGIPTAADLNTKYNKKHKRRSVKMSHWSCRWPLDLSSDLVGFGAGRTGEETETEEQAGAGHRHNGPDQLRTFHRLHLLLHFNPLLHLSLLLLTQMTNDAPTPQRYNKWTAKGPKQYTAKQGGGVTAEMGGAVCAYVCARVCVFCLQPPYVAWARVLASDWDAHAYTGETCQLTAFDYCGCRCLWFASFWFQEFFVVMKRLSGKN